MFAAMAPAMVAHAQIEPEWTLPLGLVTASSVRFADVDGNGVKDIVWATMGPLGNPFSSGSVRVVDITGAPLPGWPVEIASPIAGSTVAVGDIDNNGDMELVFEAWSFVYVLNHDGTNYPGWPIATGTSDNASPALADLDGDGDLEIIVPFSSTMHVFHHTGVEMRGWPQSAADDFQGAGVGDVDGDGALEIVAGTWLINFPDQGPFELYMWETDGSLAPGFPVGDLGSIRGPISLGDVDNDGAIEIVARAGDTLHVFDAAGQLEAGWPVGFTDPIRNATTGLGDLDGDGDLEILIAGFEMNALHHDGSVVAGFPVGLPVTGNVNSGAIIASVDDDASTPEILIKVNDAIAGLDNTGAMLPGFPLALFDDNNSATFSASPAVDDVDGDGDVEIAGVSVSGTIAYFDLSEPYNAAASPWPMFQHDLHNTSFLAPGDEGVLGDLDGDGMVGTSDLILLLGQWGPCDDCDDCSGDLDGDCSVGTGDLILLLGNWG